MSIRTRIEKLERQSKEKADTACALYNARGDEVEAEIVTMPAHKVEGLARLSDGTQVPVVYDAYVIRVRLPSDFEGMEDEPQLDEGKLYYRRRPGSKLQLEPGNFNVLLPDDLCVEDLI